MPQKGIVRVDVSSTAPSPAPPARRLHVERLQGIDIHGWAWDPKTPGHERLSVLVGDQELAVRVTRHPRADVSQALGIDSSNAGFSIELPAAVWEAMAATGQGVSITVNERMLPHPPIWPRPASVANPTSLAGAAPANAERVRRQTLLQEHSLAAARWQPAIHAPDNAVPEWQAPLHAEVEGIARLCIYGWCTGATGDLSADIEVNGRLLGAPFRRVERSDVAQLLELDQQDVGFEVELPAALWDGAAPEEHLTLQLLLNGQAVGTTLRLQRTDLPRLLDQAMTHGDAGSQRVFGLLVLEHLLRTGQWASLSSNQHTWLRELAHRADVGYLLAPQAAGAGAESAASAAEWHSLPRPSPWLGHWLSRPAPARWALAGLTWLRQRSAPWALRLELMLTRRIGLFDRRFYLAQVGASAPAQAHPIPHYVCEGDARALSPMALFDPKHYQRQLEGGAHPGINRLLHYALWGRFNGLSPSPWIDPAHYRATYADVRRGAVDSAAHFHNAGWREARKPLPDFDSTAPTRAGVLRRMRRDHAGAIANPLMRYLVSGLPERVALPSDGRPPWFASMQLDGRDYLDRAPWAQVPARPSEPAVDVLVPVYGGHQETLRCLWSVLAAPQRRAAEVVVVDDRGPEPALAQMLEWLSSQGLITLLVNECNLGFVRSVNRGLALHPERDVVILNADTVVYGDWLDRLLAHADAQPKAASITPLSNNATVCSYPRTVEDNDELPEPQARALDAAAARLNAGVHVPTPSGVGFCMYMRRQALQDVGDFDFERFGRGYGEENDWCVRVFQAGWQNLIAADVYVTHSGSVSFGDETSPRVQAAVKQLLASYPDYQQRIDAHLAADPLHAARARLDAARLVDAAQAAAAVAAAVPATGTGAQFEAQEDAEADEVQEAASAGQGAGFVLSVNHARGGGTTRHEREAAQPFARRGLALLQMRPGPNLTVQLFAPQLLACPNLVDLSADPNGLLGDILALIPLREIHVHHLADFPPALGDTLVSLAQRHGARLIVTLHDYHMVCPRINLVGASGRYCGEPDADGCNRCLQYDADGRAAGPIAAWRERHGRLVRAATEVRVPDVDMVPRLLRYWPRLKLSVRPHEPGLHPPMPRPSTTPTRHVLVIGALSRIKGYDVLKSLALSGPARAARLKLTLLGYSSDDDGLRAAGVEVLGAYDDDALRRRIDAIDPDLIFIPSVWPETYCYVLSSAMMSGRRVAMFDIGAQARRARAHGVHALLLPLAMAGQADSLARALLLQQSAVSM